MVESLLNNQELFQFYLEFYIERFIYASVEIEGFSNDEAREMEKEVLKDAFCWLLELENDFNYFDIEELGNKVNKNFGLHGFRRINVLSGAQFDPVPPNEIRMAIYSILDNYYNMWNILDIFEREARLCIELMRIHPFEDGNKRITKLLLNSNLLKNNKAPVIITDQDNDLFYRYIVQRDYDGLAAFLKQRSAIERNTMVGYMKNKLGQQKR